MVNKICHFYIFIIGKRPPPFKKMRVILIGIGIMQLCFKIERADWLNWFNYWVYDRFYSKFFALFALRKVNFG